MAKLQELHTFSGWNEEDPVVVLTDDEAQVYAGGDAAWAKSPTGKIEDSQISIMASQVPTTGSTWFYVEMGSGSYTGFAVRHGDIEFVDAVSGTGEDITSLPYNPVTHLWWRLRESSNTLYWDTSSDGINWTTRRTKASVSDYSPNTSAFVYVDVATEVAIFKYFNVIPTIPLAFNRPPTDRFRYIVEEARTGEILTRDLVVNKARVMRTLSGPSYVEFDVDYHDPSVAGIYFKPWGHWIHVEAEILGERRIFASTLVQPSTVDKKTGVLKLKGQGFSAYPKGMPMLFNWNPIAVDVFEVVHHIWDHLQGYPNGDLRVDVTPAESGLIMLPGYAFDGEIWNLDFFAEFIRATDRLDCGDHINGLAKDTPFDYREQSAWNEDRTEIERVLEMAHPRLGALQENLTFVINENVYEAEAHVETEIDWISDIGVAGWFPGKEYSVELTNADPHRYRRYLAEDDAKINSTERAAAWAHRRLTRRQTPAYWESIVVDMYHPNAPFGYYDVGDSIVVQGFMPWVGEVSQEHKVMSIIVSEDEGRCELKLKAEGAFNYDPIIFDPTPTPPPGEGPNMLLNGYFGANMSGWSINKGQWFRVTDYGNTNAGSARIDCNDNGEWMTTTDHIAVAAGEVYEVEAHMRQNGIEGGGADAAQLQIVTNLGVTVVDSLDVPEGNETWQTLTGQFTVPAGATTLDVRLYVDAAVTDGIMWWDDVVLQIVSVP